MIFVVKVFISKTGKKSACIVGKTDLQDYMLTFDKVAICLALGATKEQIEALDCGEYEIQERR